MTRKTKVPPAKPDGFVKMVWVCTGKTTLVRGVPGIGFRVSSSPVPNSEDLKLGDEHFVAAKIAAGMRPGGMYEIEYNSSTRQVRFGGYRYVGSYPDSDQVGVWQAQTRRLEIERRVAKQEKDETTRQYILEALRPLRLAYVSTDTLGKLALEVQVLAYLRHGKTDLATGGR